MGLGLTFMRLGMCFVGLSEFCGVERILWGFGLSFLWFGQIFIGFGLSVNQYLQPEWHQR